LSGEAIGLGIGFEGLLVDIQFNRGKGLKESLNDEIVDGLSQNALANAGLLLLAASDTQVLGSAFVLDHHFVAAFAAVGDSMQEGGAWPGNATGLVAIVFGAVILQHGLDMLESFPGDVGGILILDHDFPPFER
jgi:hypothetical protein